MEEEAVHPKELLDRLLLAIADVQATTAKLQETRERLEETQSQWRTSRTSREASHDNAYARLLARFESQSVIEQAKGILMAEGGCTPDEAFDILRRASQRQNVRVRDLAAQIVKRASDRPPSAAHRPATSSQPAASSQQS